MRTLLIAILIILMASPVIAQSLDRSMEMEFSGDIEYTSESGSPAGQSVLTVKGEGTGEIGQSTEGTGETFSYTTAGGTKNVEVISGVKLYTEDIYVTQLTGNAKWQDSYSAEIDLFPTISIATENDVVGSMARRIDMGNNGLWINERFSVTGVAWVLDQILFSPDDEDEE